MTAPAKARLSAGAVCTHLLWPELEPARVAGLALWLSAEERDRADGFRHEADRRAFCGAHGLAREALSDAGDLPPEAFRIREGPWGRPEIDPNPLGLSFNLSHTERLVACTIAQGRRVGVDVELLSRPREPAKLARRALTEREQSWLASAPDGETARERFVTLWTLKEAYLKALGRGLSEPLQSVEFEVGDGLALRRRAACDDAAWIFHQRRPDEHHLLAIAVEAVGPAPLFEFRTRPGTAPAPR